MITQLELGNVRLFEGTDIWKFPLTRLSAFCGTNSAGKSTILRSLLLLLQSNETSDVMSRAGQLRLSGELVDVGSYESFVSHGHFRSDVVVGITIEDSLRARHLRTLPGWKSESHEGPEPEFVTYTLNARFRFGLLKTSESSAQLGLLEAVLDDTPTRSSFTTQAYLKEASFDLSVIGHPLSWTLALKSDHLSRGAEPDYDIFIPADHFGAWGGHAVMEVPKVDAGTHVRVEATTRGILPSGLWAKAKAKRRTRNSEDDDVLTYFPLPPLIRDATIDLGLAIEGIHYLGPLRSPAKRFYLTNLDTTPRLDPTGEFLPYVLRDKYDTEIRYLPPKADEEVRAPLKRAVNEWLFYFRTGELLRETTGKSAAEIGLTSVKDVLLELTLQSFVGEAHALADSGFGYSQLLPIIVGGLIAELGETIVIEQPELHLNPSLQVRMAEFLRSLARAGKLVIVETHSEHIINALRVLAAESFTEKEEKNYSILYLDAEHGTPLLLRLEVQSDGTVPDWPRGFMGEAMHLSSRLIRAQQRRKVLGREGGR